MNATIPGSELKVELYSEQLWWLMHHSENERDRISIALTSYYDDSGTDGPSPIAAIGGPAMMRESFVHFDGVWRRMLRDYRIESPLHMKDFVRPYGKHVGMHYEMKLALFSEAADIINKHKNFSVSICVPQDDFRSAVPADVAKELMSPYGFAFFCAVIVNIRSLMLIPDSQVSMGYIVDSGSESSKQLQEAHAELQRLEKGMDGVSHQITKAMAFDTDDNVSALQAADVVAWSARRREIGNGLTGEFEPLNAVLSPNPDENNGWIGTHENRLMSSEDISRIAKPIHDWLHTYGKLPSIPDMLR